MSQENVALIQEAFAAWNDQGVAGLESVLAEDVDWHDPPQAPDASVHRGKEETMGFLRGWEAGSGEMGISFSVEDIRGADDRYMVVTRTRVTGEGSGVTLPEHHWFFVMHIRDGKLAGVHVFLNPTQALEAAGLSE